MKFFSKSALNRATCLESAALAAALIGLSTSTVAFAQADPAAPAECADENNNGTCDSEESSGIVVTGSRIARPTLDSPVPLTTVGAAELTEQGDISLGDALNDLPSLRSTFSQGNSTRFIGTAGLSVLDLRGIGVERTLVLVNGKRHVTSLPGEAWVDVNTIPVDLLDRVDVVTGGNSAVYGSDAVAGVVNFVLKRSYEGLTARGQGGISSRGDRGTYFGSLTWGKNFADGRGNIAMAAEYAVQKPLYFRDRDYLSGAYSGRCQFQTVEPTGGEAGGTDGITDTAFECGVVNGSISDGGTIGRVAAGGRYLRFGPDGNLFVDIPQGHYEAGGSTNVRGAQGSTLRNTGMMAAGGERASFNVLAHYDISDALRPFIEAKYVRIKASQEGQPSFWQGSMKSFFANTDEQFDAISNLRCNNGFLNSQALATLQSYGLCTNVAAGTFNISRFNTDFRGRGEDHTRETYRIVGGIEGTFNDDWNYELSANYGRFEANVHSTNNLRLYDINGNLDGFLLSTDAVVAPAGFSGTNFVTNSSGQRVICRVNEVTNARPDCVPLNVFGSGAPSQAALDFSHIDGVRNEWAEQFVVLGSVSGDLSQLFELPGGPISFALGGEYRQEQSHSEWDELTASGATFMNAIAPFAPPKLTVKEAFGEINVPLLKDMPFFKELSFGAAARVSDYNSATGTVWAWNVQGIWAPVEDIRFRAAYATSVRAPTQGDLYSTASDNFAFFTDPCATNVITSNPNFAANCAAAGVPTTQTAAGAAFCAGTGLGEVAGGPFIDCRSSSLRYLSGGNPALKAERGKSLTIGMVVEPSFIPGLNFTVDYYRINVKDRISALGAQQIVTLCYSAAGGINNPYCANVNRDPTTGFFDEPVVIAGGINFAEVKTEGVDFDVSYRKTFDNGHKFQIRGIATYVRKIDNYTDPTNPLLPNRQKSELGDPEWAANVSFNYDFGDLDLGWSMRYIGKQTIGTWEAQNPYTGVCPASGSTGYTNRVCTPGQLTTLDPQNLDAFPRVFYPDVLYHNFRMNYELPDKKFSFYLGLDNVFDKKPPFGLLGTAGGDPFDTYGRFFYAGFKANF